MPAPDEHAASPECGQGSPRPRYRLRPVMTPVPTRSDAGGKRQAAPEAATGSGEGGSYAPHRPAAGRPHAPETRDPFLRAATEDDDGYDPFSDRPPVPEPTFQGDPWG